MNYDHATLTDSREDQNHIELFNTDVTPLSLYDAVAAVTDAVADATGRFSSAGD